MGVNPVNKREPYLDNARAIAILAVILSHTMSQIIYMRGDTSGLVAEHIIVMFDMPLFTILAGYCGLPALLRINSIKDLYKYVWKQWKRIMLPAGFLSVLFYCLSGGILESVSKVIVKFFYPGLFWYLIMLFIVFCYVGIGRLLVSKLQNKSFWVLCFFCLLALPVKFVYVGEMMPYFVIGMILKNYKILDKLQFNYSMLIALSSLCIIMIVLYESNYSHFINFYKLTFMDFLKSGAVWIWVIRILVCSVLSLAIIIFCKVFNGIIPLLTKVGTITLPLYTISSLFFYTFRLPVINRVVLHSNIFIWANSTFSHRLISLTIVFVFITCMSGLIILIAEKFRWGKLLIIGK